ncbi:elongator complex protein 2-like isoform X2 [Artemia franciscana]|uniref:Elongator complex protein 2 n=1 Tax=Artemia franciscana TaxID=6661 RepID=A0AA88I6H3_ARTSF|nr:hypothetical protein QYM36_004598 [Artemia franciscana]
MSFETAFISSACNRVPSCISWGPNNLLLYGACHSVAIYDPNAYSNQGAVVKTLVSHNGRVNSVRWAKKLTPTDFIKDEDLFVSAASDRKVVVWKKEEGGAYNFKPMTSLIGHAAIVNVAELMLLRNGQILVASADSDAAVILWSLSNTGEVISQLSLGQKPLALNMKFIPIQNQNFPLLAIGCDDFKIHIYTADGEPLKLLQLVGHEDWIRNIEATFDVDGNTVIATSAQDSLIRLWKIKEKKGEETSSKLKISENTFIFQGAAYVATTESVLGGHEGWVYGLDWHKNNAGKLRLLSASMDKTMIIWEEDENGIWADCVRVGEVGGNTLGFLGCTFSPDGCIILAHGFQGAFHMWRLDEISNQWLPRHSFGGHFDSVVDLAWDPKGVYVISCSTDQTTRLFAPCPTGKESYLYAPWYEIARPQVHGYDMACLALADRYKLISGADEKVARVFQAPEDFLLNFGRLCGIAEDSQKVKNAPRGASVPALGLSNKPVYDTDLGKEKLKPKSQSDMYYEPTFASEVMKEPPTEETLLQNTLWPEVQKLYGHGFELFSVASNHNGTILATACKATRSEHAGIILWNQETWNQIGVLQGHNLTITQICFSPSDEYLLSVSRDRTWVLHKKNGESFSFLCSSTKEFGHTRIIWAADWSIDSLYFVTGSRDKTVKVWGVSTDTVWKPISQGLELEESVTSVAFAPISGKYIIAVGLENGIICVYEWSQKAEVVWNRKFVMDSSVLRLSTLYALPSVLLYPFEELVLELRNTVDHVTLTSLILVLN